MTDRTDPEAQPTAPLESTVPPDPAGYLALTMLVLIVVLIGLLAIALIISA